MSSRPKPRSTAKRADDAFRRILALEAKFRLPRLTHEDEVCADNLPRGVDGHTTEELRAAYREVRNALGYIPKRV